MGAGAGCGGSCCDGGVKGGGLLKSKIVGVVREDARGICCRERGGRRGIRGGRRWGGRRIVEAGPWIALWQTWSA